MKSSLSSNTQAILLLTAPLMAGKGKASSDLLTPSEYNKLAQYLEKNNLEPADLVSRLHSDAGRKCGQVIKLDRLERLLSRGLLLAQALERWHSRALWVISRADPEYPRMLKSRLKRDAPSVLYGCGDAAELNAGGLAVVGSRHVDDDLIQYTRAVGGLAAQAGKNIVSGGARGIDQAAMHGALDAGGRAVGVLADSLEKAVLTRYNRDMLLSNQLTLVSPYDPAAGFNVGNAMRRNKVIYALSDASLVVSSDLNKGGTWAGAVEQLDKLNLVSVFVRSTGPHSDGLIALANKGARPWPDPTSVRDFAKFFHGLPKTTTPSQSQLPFSDAEADVGEAKPLNATPAANGAGKAAARVVETTNSLPLGSGPSAEDTDLSALPSPLATSISSTSTRASNHSVALFDVVRNIVRDLAKKPMRVDDLAAVLEVTSSQAEIWLRRLASEGVVKIGDGEDVYETTRDDGWTPLRTDQSIWYDIE